jgi:hypothetical protein
LVKKLQSHTNSEEHLPKIDSATFSSNCRDKEFTPPSMVAIGILEEFRGNGSQQCPYYHCTRP